MNLNSTYSIEHEAKGITAKGLTFSELRAKAFRIRSSKNFSPIADTDYTVIDEKTGERMPMQHIPN